MPRSGFRSVAPGERAVRSRRPGKAMPGPDAVERLVVAARAGWRCEVCGRVLALEAGDSYRWVGAHSFHHRQPRGAGGTRDPEANTPPRLLLLCGTATSPNRCHGMVESQRALAVAHGWLVPRPIPPQTVPVLLHTGALVLLTCDGRYVEVEG